MSRYARKEYNFDTFVDAICFDNRCPPGYAERFFSETEEKHTPEQWVHLILKDANIPQEDYMPLFDTFRKQYVSLPALVSSFTIPQEIFVPAEPVKPVKIKRKKFGNKEPSKNPLPDGTPSKEWLAWKAYEDKCKKRCEVDWVAERRNQLGNELDQLELRLKTFHKDIHKKLIGYETMKTRRASLIERLFTSKKDQATEDELQKLRFARGFTKEVKSDKELMKEVNIDEDQLRADVINEMDQEYDFLIDYDVYLAKLQQMNETERYASYVATLEENLTVSERKHPILLQFLETYHEFTVCYRIFNLLESFYFSFVPETESIVNSLGVDPQQDNMTVVIHALLDYCEEQNEVPSHVMEDLNVNKLRVETFHTTHMERLNVASIAKFGYNWLTFIQYRVGLATENFNTQQDYKRNLMLYEKCKRMQLVYVNQVKAARLLILWRLAQYRKGDNVQRLTHVKRAIVQETIATAVEEETVKRPRPTIQFDPNTQDPWNQFTNRPRKNFRTSFASSQGILNAIDAQRLAEKQSNYNIVLQNVRKLGGYMDVTSFYYTSIDAAAGGGSLIAKENRDAYNDFLQDIYVIHEKFDQDLDTLNQKATTEGTALTMVDDYMNLYLEYYTKSFEIIVQYLRSLSDDYEQKIVKYENEVSNIGDELTLLWNDMNIVVPTLKSTEQEAQEKQKLTELFDHLMQLYHDILGEVHKHFEPVRFNKQKVAPVDTEAVAKQAREDRLKEYTILVQTRKDIEDEVRFYTNLRPIYYARLLPYQVPPLSAAKFENLDDALQTTVLTDTRNEFRKYAKDLGSELDKLDVEHWREDPEYLLSNSESAVAAESDPRNVFDKVHDALNRIHAALQLRIIEANQKGVKFDDDDTFEPVKTVAPTTPTLPVTTAVTPVAPVAAAVAASPALPTAPLITSTSATAPPKKKGAKKPKEVQPPAKIEKVPAPSSQPPLSPPLSIEELNKLGLTSADVNML
jgi:hypothetical protein